MVYREPRRMGDGCHDAGDIIAREVGQPRRVGWGQTVADLQEIGVKSGKSEGGEIESYSRIFQSTKSPVRRVVSGLVRGE